MTKPKLRFGNVLFWLLWPVFYVYLKPSHRTRVLVIAGNKLLVVMDIMGRREWTLPGGGRHPNESSPDSAARELMEETGLVIKPADLKSLTVDQIVHESGFSYKIDTFWVRLPKIVEIGEDHTMEIYAVEWLPIEDLVEGKIAFSKTAKGLLGTWLEQHHLLD